LDALGSSASFDSQSFGSRELAAGPVVAIDLSTASRYHNLEVSGLIGYPALRDSVLIVNYRDGLVRIDSK
jgi:hypothetical protein